MKDCITFERNMSRTLQHKYLQYGLSTNETVLSDTEYGKVKGVKRLTIYNEPYYSFEAIPYAQPPIGELRFKAPQRPTPWTDVKDCTHTKDKAVQVQFVLHKVEGSEDCLYLNVYTNNLSPETPRPVMVFIHGGGFMIGEASRDWHGPDYFMQKDVILVTVQYRLGVLGFLSLNTPSFNIPGNAGLKDQVMALKWIKNNCAHFGGNPDCITVFGQSAGGASTQFMMLTEQTKGLFHRAIPMSGSAVCSLAITNCAHRAFTIAKLVGYKGEDSEKEILEFLLNAKAKDLIRVEEEVLTPEERKKRIFAFAPVVEPYATPDCVVPKHPREMMANAWGSSIPMMIGNTSKEGLFWTPETKLTPNVIQDLDSCVYFVPSELVNGQRLGEETVANGLKIKKAHVTGESPTVDNYLDLCSHFIFWFPMHRFIQARLAHTSAAPTYLYRFDFDSENLINPYRIMRFGRGVKGVSHADEMSYLFWNLLAQRLDKNSREYRIIERTVGIWTQFAMTGNPYDEKIPGMDALTWEPLKKSDKVYKCLNINDELKVIDLPEMEKIQIWESVFEKKRDLFC